VKYWNIGESPRRQQKPDHFAETRARAQHSRRQETDQVTKRLTRPKDGTLVFTGAKRITTEDVHKGFEPPQRKRLVHRKGGALVAVGPETNNGRRCPAPARGFPATWLATPEQPNLERGLKE